MNVNEQTRQLVCVSSLVRLIYKQPSHQMVPELFMKILVCLQSYKFDC